MNLSDKNGKITFDSLVSYKRNLKNQIAEQQVKLQESYHQLTAPFSRQDTTSSFMCTFAKSVAIFDGLMFGFRMFRKIRNIFRR